jgi:hypothetical protein
MAEEPSGAKEKAPTAMPTGGATRDAAQAGKDPMKDLLDQLERDQPKIATLDRVTGRAVRKLVQDGADPDRREETGFRTQVAYAVEDVQRLSVGKIAMPAELRAEMTKLAGTSMGLENERMLGLMRATPDIADRAVVRQIRYLGEAIGRRADQNTPDIQSQIETLENKYRLTPRPAEPQPAGPTAVSGTRPGGLTGGTADDGGPPRNPQGNAAQPTDQRQPPQQPVMRSGTILDSLVTALRAPAGNNGSAPWDPPPTAMADRLSNMERVVRESADQKAFERVIKSSRAAVDALEGFDNGAGANIMSRIREAAKTEPGGISAVLAEMKDGGRFADLRRQFNNALETDMGLARAYDKAAGALERYGAERSSAQEIIARRPDASAITQRFEKLDAEIGEAAAKTPSRNDGKSMMEDLTKKAAEIVSRAVEQVKAFFSRSHCPSPGVSASP